MENPTTAVVKAVDGKKEENKSIGNDQPLPLISEAGAKNIETIRRGYVDWKTTPL